MELRECPFCEGEAENVTIDGWPRIACKKCNLVSPIHYRTFDVGEKIWNTRPREAQLEKERDAWKKYAKALARENNAHKEIDDFLPDDYLMLPEETENARAAVEALRKGGE